MTTIRASGAGGGMIWGVVGKGGIPHVRSEALSLVEYLRERGQEVLIEKGLQGEYTLQELADKVDLFMTVGGDGTILMVQHVSDKPIFGVNAGAIGFMAEVEPPLAEEGLDRILAGKYRIEERSRLACVLDGQRLPDATNEVTMQTSKVAKILQFRIDVDEEHLDTIRGDGIIVSTPTGSTGYAMSVGGPLVHPSVGAMVLAPIAPFRLSARPWVIPEKSRLKLTVMQRDSRPGEEQAFVVIDGQHARSVASGDQIEVFASDKPARFIRLGSGFYERVRTKLTR